MDSDSDQPATQPPDAPTTGAPGGWSSYKVHFPGGSLSVVDTGWQPWSGPPPGNPDTPPPCPPRPPSLVVHPAPPRERRDPLRLHMLPLVAVDPAHDGGVLVILDEVPGTAGQPVRRVQAWYEEHGGRYLRR